MRMPISLGARARYLIAARRVFIAARRVFSVLAASALESDLSEIGLP